MKNFNGPDDGLLTVQLLVAYLLDFLDNSLFLIHADVLDMEASVLSLSLLALRMVPSIVDTAVQINNAFVVSLSV